MAKGELRLGQTLIALAGPVGADKRVVTEHLRNKIKRPAVKFSDYLNKLAKLNHQPTSYQMLQDLGAEVIERKGWESFCTNVLRLVSKDLKDTIIIDGLRHVRALNELRKFSRPDDVFVVYLDVTRDTQIEHLRQRGVKEKDVQKILLHPVEAEATTLRRLADHTIEADEDVGTVVASLMERLSKSHDREKQTVFTWSGLDSSTLDEIYSNPGRYESLREIVRLVYPGLDSASVCKWLHTPNYELQRRTPLDVIERGKPEDAIDAAVRLAEL